MKHKKVLVGLLMLGVTAIVAAEFNQVDAAASSITINDVTLELQTDADSNGYVNVGDTIRVTADVTNTDGAAATAGTVVTVDLPQYQGLDEVLMTLVTDTSGTNDIYQNDYVVAKGTVGTWGIDVAVDNAASAVSVTVFDNDDNGAGEVTATSNNIGDGVIDTTTNGVDTIAPTDQDTVFADSITRYPDETFEIVLPGDAATWHLAPAGLTTTGQVFAQAEVSQGGSDETTQVPDTWGEYRLYVIDNADNVSAQSSAILTVVDRPGGGGSTLASYDDDSNTTAADDDNADDMEDSEDEGDDVSDSANSVIGLVRTVLRSDLTIEAKLNILRLLLGKLL